MADEVPPLKVDSTTGSKAVTATNLGANVGTFAMLAYYMLGGLPAVEQRHTESLVEMKATQKESMAVVNATLTEMNRTLQLQRDELRDARHDLTELRRGHSTSEPMKAGPPNKQ